MGERLFGKLFIVGTPIGNLGDITLRAIDVLREVDFLVVEDSRVTLKLLNHFGIQKPMISYFKHCNNSKLTLILKKLQEGETAAIVSDAGMPCISDPGEELVKLCIEHEIEVVPIPGVNAALTGLVSSGIESASFCFEGFLTINKRDRQKKLEELKDEKRTMIFFEAPHKLRRTLADLLEFLGDRKICVARELTKIHEQFLRASLSEVVCYFETTLPRGEFVLIVQGQELPEDPTGAEDLIGVKEEALELLKNGVSLSEISRLLASKKMSRNKIYKMLLNNPLT
ncbi:ribosomal RNA small subunit methyltransferase I [Clostridia bacterium]|nr:ribosomal RNA small subunit methyltransferase I [Clostridia bacterium]